MSHLRRSADDRGVLARRSDGMRHRARRLPAALSRRRRAASTRSIRARASRRRRSTACPRPARTAPSGCHAPDDRGRPDRDDLHGDARRRDRGDHRHDRGPLRRRHSVKLCPDAVSVVDLGECEELHEGRLSPGSAAASAPGPGHPPPNLGLTGHDQTRLEPSHPRAHRGRALHRHRRLRHVGTRPHVPRARHPGLGLRPRRQPGAARTRRPRRPRARRARRREPRRRRHRRSTPARSGPRTPSTPPAKERGMPVIHRSQALLLADRRPPPRLGRRRARQDHLDRHDRHRAAGAGCRSRRSSTAA